jgi:multidrug resistance efflux pump
MRRKVLIGALAVLGLLGACIGLRALAPQAPAAVQSQEAVENLLASSLVTAEGVILPVRKASLSFSTGGILQGSVAAEGEQVTEGALLARLEATDQEQAVAQAEAALSTARAVLAQMEAAARPQEVTAAQEEVSAASANLAGAGAACDQAQATLRGARASEAGASAALDQAQATLQGAKAGEAAAQAGLEAAQAEVGTARAAVAAAQAELALVRAGANSQQRAIAKLQVDQARNELWGAQSQRDSIGGAVGRMQARQSDLDGADAAVGSAHVALNIAEVAYEEIETDPRPEEIAPARARIDSARSAMSTAEVQVEAAKARLEGAGAEVALAEAQVAAAEAGLDGVKAEVALAKAQLAAAESQREAAQARAAQAQAQLELLKAGPKSEDVAVARARVAEAKAGLRAAEVALAKADLLSPFAGTVVEVAFEEGEMVPATAPFITLADLMELRVETTDLDEWGAVDVYVGQAARVTVNAFEDKLLTGRVTAISSRGTILNTGDTAYTVTIALDEQDPSLRWGMTTKVEFLEE